MNDVLARWNGLHGRQAVEEILPCCGSRAWAHKMVAQRPIADEIALLGACDVACKSLTESDWLEAFRSHPRIGETIPPVETSERSATWSRDEQLQLAGENGEIKMTIANGNRAYEERFGRTFIICASGKSAPEILENLVRRMRNDDIRELREATEQQRQIARLRLGKWLAA
jgi:2-oxo-4-hydroxy-4-carboxy-5-ureidoimidazoline decarboxylase